MNDKIRKIKKHPLFDGISYDDIKSLFDILPMKYGFFKKNEDIVSCGGKVNLVGIILSGSLLLLVEDDCGHTTILNVLGKGQTFGELFVFSNTPTFPVGARAKENTEILFIDFEKTVAALSDNHSREILKENIFKLFLHKSLMQNTKLLILSRRTIREKLLYFFDLQRGDSKEITIPFDREGLADYLYADRSAVSRELGKMRDEGLIKFNKNKFEILY